MSAMLARRIRRQARRSPPLSVALRFVAIAAISGCSQRDNVQVAYAGSASSTTDFLPFECAEGLTADSPEKQVAQRGRELHLVAPAAYVLFQRRSEAGPVSLAELGTPCAGSGYDRAKCKQSIADLVAQDSRCPATAGCDGIYALVERDGLVESAATLEQIARVLRPIDSAEEAWLVAQSALLIPGSFCGQAETSAFRTTTDGYELRYPYASKACDGHNPELSVAVVAVKREGSVRVLQHSVTQPQTDPCPEATQQTQ